MEQLNQGRSYVSDPPFSRRVAFLVQEGDVGLTQEMYLGQEDYTFKPEDVGRLIEVVMDMSPGFLSWRFGSMFSDLTEQYPDPFPYVQVE
ncbi:hypothetical protein D3C76_28410 [compost metagenome]